MATHLPQDLVDEILLHLPVKDILRFKSVSKTWQSRLTSPSFINSYNRHPRRTSDHPQQIVFSPTHLNPKACTCRSPPAAATLINIVAGPSMDLILPPTATRRRWSALGPSSTGIYCLNDYKSIWFCNPATREYVFTEQFPQFGQKQYGFGKVGTDYKVIVLVMDNKSDQTTSFSSFVYGLKSRQWKSIDMEGLELDLIHDTLESCPQRLFNGRWHWTAVTRFNNNDFSVLSFDFRDETFRLMGGPGGYNVGSDVNQDVSSGVFVLKDRLSAIFLTSWWVTKNWTNSTVDVWMMMDYGVEESWRRIYRIEPFVCGEITRLVGIQIKHDSGGEEDWIEKLYFEFEFRCGFIIISCNSKSSGYQTIGDDILSDFVCWNVLGVSTYRETLEPL